MRSMFLVGCLLLAVASAQNQFFGCTMQPVAGVTTSGTGSVACFYGLNDGENWLSCHYTYTGLSSNAILAHWHVGTPATASGNVTFVFDTPSGTSAPGGYLYSFWRAGSAGSSWLPQFGVDFPTQVASCASGAGCYFNLHTTTNPKGELRCEGTPFSSGTVYRAWAPLISAPTTGPPAGTGSGSFAIWFGMLQDGTKAWGYSVAFQGLTSPAFMAHVHLGNNGTELGSGGIVTWLNISAHNPSSFSGEFSSVTLDSVAASSPVAFSLLTTAELTGNHTYVNIHTTDWGNGELRGNFGFAVSGAGYASPVAVLVFALMAMLKIVA